MRARAAMSAGLLVTALLAGCTTATGGSGQSPASTPSGPSIPAAWADGQLDLGIVGDSITVGWMADNESGTYREQVRDAYYPGTLQLTWVAEPGWESGQMISLAPEVINDAEVVLIATGTNDGKSGPSGLQGQYPELLSMVRDDQVLLCLGPWGRGAEASAAAKKYCEDAGGAFLATDDLAHLVGPRSSEGWPVPRDEFHPNQAGHDALASLVVAQLGGSS
jgi:acyl-CoA thioesterase-1